MPKLSSDATLKTITSSAGTLSPSVSNNTKSYTLTLAAGTTTIPTLSATAVDDGATVEIAQAENLNGTAHVRIVSEDIGKKTRYHCPEAVVINSPHGVFPAGPASEILSRRKDLPAVPVVVQNEILVLLSRLVIAPVAEQVFPESFPCGCAEEPCRDYLISIDVLEWKRNTGGFE